MESSSSSKHTSGYNTAASSPEPSRPPTPHPIKGIHVNNHIVFTPREIQESIFIKRLLADLRLNQR
jgi:hypothetical protein